MKKKILIIIGVIILIALIALGVMLFLDFKEEDKLKEELQEISNLSNETNINTEEIKARLSRRISRGDYLKVEDAYKEYLTDALNNITNIYSILNDSKIENLLSIENYKNDGPEFTETKEYINNTKEELQNLKNEYTSLFTEEKIMSYINNKNVDEYYIDFYKDELMGIPEKEDQTVEREIDGVIKILDSSNTIIDFLINNKDNWKIENENIVFANQELTNEFLENIDNMLNNIPGTYLEKDFGTYEIPVDWMESKTHSTENKFFYVKEGEDDEEKPNNISVNVGSNNYSEDEHESFRNAIINQLSMQVGNDENVEVTANGSNTTNGYIVYTFNIIEKDENITTTQYYIIGDHKYVLVQETKFMDSEETDDAAQKIVDTFKWK